MREIVPMVISSVLAIIVLIVSITTTGIDGTPTDVVSAAEGEVVEPTPEPEE